MPALLSGTLNGITDPKASLGGFHWPQHLAESIRPLPAAFGGPAGRYPGQRLFSFGEHSDTAASRILLDRLLDERYPTVSSKIYAKRAPIDIGRDSSASEIFFCQH